MHSYIVAVSTFHILPFASYKSSHKSSKNTRSASLAHCELVEWRLMTLSILQKIFHWGVRIFESASRRSFKPSVKLTLGYCFDILWPHHHIIFHYPSAQGNKEQKGKGIKTLASAEWCRTGKTDRNSLQCKMFRHIYFSSLILICCRSRPFPSILCFLAGRKTDRQPPQGLSV